jgi:hypothetical protein
MNKKKNALYQQNNGVYLINYLVKMETSQRLILFYLLLQLLLLFSHVVLQELFYYFKKIIKSIGLIKTVTNKQEF